MTWTYSQSTGKLTKDALEFEGYSGSGEHKNIPAADSLHNLGPIPKGFYTIRGPFTHPDKGPVCLFLIPHSENHMYGRGGFLIHGDSIRNPGTASFGCIVQNRPCRDIIAATLNEDNELEVVE